MFVKCSLNTSKQETYDYVDSEIPLQPCLDSSALNEYYYNKDEKKLYDKCDIFETINSHKCTYCSRQNNYVYNNYCVNNCPLEAPYFIKENFSFSKTNRSVKEIKKCVSSSSSSYKI